MENEEVDGLTIPEFEGKILEAGRKKSGRPDNTVYPEMGEIKESRHHLLVGFRNGEEVEDPPFDEIRLIENIGTLKEIRYVKGSVIEELT